MKQRKKRYLLKLLAGSLIVGGIILPVHSVNTVLANDNTYVDTELEPPQPPSREEAIERARNGYAASFRENLIYAGVTEEMLAQLPEDAVFNATVDYQINHYIGGDYGTQYHFFITMYPEVFDEELEDTTDAGEDTSTSDATNNLENAPEIKEYFDTSVELEELPLLERNHIYHSKQGDYQIKSVFLLQSDEAGNVDPENYLLGITYAYTNTTEEAVADYEAHWLANTTISQLNESGRESLNLGEYQIVNEEADLETTELPSEVSANETIESTAYYSLPNIDNELAITSLFNNTMEDYKLDINTLLKLPPQSAVYVNETNPVLAYLFDFQNVYLIYQENDLTTEWDNVEEVIVKAFENIEWSEEAQQQLENLGEIEFTGMTVVHFSPV